ncbi:mitochondrial carrier homolog 2 [Bactrocera neohumeralis]|uniref:mitochondrial carrier homolog 2 n=1 Tax=Bactrocera tryoni TaxID=59916 RepID=UPI001A998B39|nr:mitochondrial carrier homolog 2 [Bactrocera tryoni]XP_050333182.1 mitochondrial carrier homolog 2 [Bactrocera neohumeralis]
MAALDPTFVNINDNDENKEVNEWIRFGMRLAVSAALHPFEYSKVLIQLGYEPIPARPGTSLLGKPIMVLPNIFQYAGYIRKMDGFYGCYRGLAPKLVGSIVSMIFSEKIADRVGLPAIDDKDKDDNDLTDEELYVQFKVNLKRDVVLSVSGIIVSHPFHVISLRMMAQFIGRETLYQSIFGSIKEIYKTEGVLGFFSGLVPKLLCDVVCLVLTSTTVFVLNKYVIKDKIGRQYNAGFVQFAFSSILYPFQVVSSCMAVTGSRLMAGRPPVMPEYKNWVDCWNDLQARGELKRGTSLFWRSVGGSSKIVSAGRRADFAPLPTIAKYQ